MRILAATDWSHFFHSIPIWLHLPSRLSSVGRTSVLSLAARQGYTWSWHQSYVQVCGLKWFSHHAGHRKFNRCCTRDESENPLCTCDKACIQAREFKGRCHQKSVTGLSEAPQKRTDILLKIFNVTAACILTRLRIVTVSTHWTITLGNW